MKRSKLAALALGALLLTGCASGPSEDQVDAAWDACVDDWNAHPERIQEAWDTHWEEVWEVGNLWWEFGAGDICQDQQRDMTATEFVEAWS